MKSLLLFGGICLSLAACQTQTQSFTSMSEEELFAYNQDKPVLEQVICRKEAQTSTYIRKTRCQTVKQIVYHNVNNAMALDVINFGRNYNEGLRSRD